VPTARVVNVLNEYGYKTLQEIEESKYVEVTQKIFQK
jgi:hypothetical protein